MAYDLWPGIHLLRASSNGTAADAQWRDTPLSCDEALAHVDDGGLLGLVPWSVQCVVVMCDTAEATDWPRGEGRDLCAAAQRAIGRDPRFVLAGRDCLLVYGGHLFYPAAEPIADRAWTLNGRRGGDIRGTGFVTLWDRHGFAQYVHGDDAAYASVTSGSGSGGLTAALLDEVLPQHAAEPDPAPEPEPDPAPDPAPPPPPPPETAPAPKTEPAPAPAPAPAAAPGATHPLMERLLAARTAADIVDTIWTAAYQRFCGQGDPPPPPTLPELEQWLAACRWSLPRDTALFQGLAQWDREQAGGPILPGVTMLLHRQWLNIDARGVAHPEGQHPLAPLIRRRLALAVPGIPYAIKSAASLPRVHRAGDATLLPTMFPLDKAPARPSVDLPPITVSADHCPHWLLHSYDKAGGVSMRQGRGAPWALRLFIGALLHVPVDERDGRFHTYRYPLYPDPDWPDVPAVIEWLFPGDRRWKNRTRDWHKLPEALRIIRDGLSYVPVTGPDGERYLMSLIVPTFIPDSPGANMIEFMVILPGAAAGGARLDWHVLSEYGTEGAVIYRAYLSAVALMDKSARSGHPITSQIAAPILGSDGKPIRGRGGRIARSKTDTDPNPAALYVPALTDADLTRIIGLDPKDRRRRIKAVAAFERLAADGHIDLVREGGKIRIFGPGKAR